MHHSIPRPHAGPRRRRRLLTAIVVTAVASATLSGCAPSGDAGVTTLDFFQFKGEATADFQRIVADFEAENPDIDVQLNTVPDPDTALRTLLVKGKTPDVLTVNGSGNYGQLARAGVFHDFTGDPLVEQQNPAVLDILDALGSFEGDEINALGMANNADGIVYNKQIFEEQGLEVPTTWDELIAVCDALEDAGIPAFYGTLADAWTAIPAWNALGGQLQPDDFYDDLRAEGGDVGPDSAVSFSADYTEAMEKLQTLYSYAQDGYRSRGYEDGNAAFANGESAMYLQGIWTINPILAANPDIELGVFPYPAGEDPDDVRLTSGVDVAVTIGRDTPHLAEAQRFVEYLLSPEVVDGFVESQVMFSTLADAGPNPNPVLAELVPYFDDGRIIGFIDHQIPASIPLQPIVQQYLLDGNMDAALANLDNEWRKVALRSTRTEE
ncbi:carbohydrate ABC transporter substrate-binding protein (CUT1 family) [Labedella gwakjiensis]|uniref:Carbohydrate ABC transporter substrate-binding protein (CUT1 family) n=1 Tax=Labedella gwakjiensis TaxID=390269 RepID=A0A2P8GTX2_9MICO|nr:extracellular solute-binding protein [Labedella gwakjiensis]PSL37395.1 carbohydrate ABC transporter substrate-binding protein (CUT1 family) [Labedella gwakjiensis]RUQ84714.1 extracellular solute-binding protein [Labedella gwakjiensis]